MFSLKGYLEALSPTRKIAMLRNALFFVAFLFMLMIFYRYMDLKIEARKNIGVIATQSAVIKSQKEADVSAGEAAVVIAAVKQKAEVSEAKRQVKEAEVVIIHQKKQQADVTEEPLNSTATSTENELSQLRIDWLWAKYCEANKMEDKPCVQ